MTTINLEMRTLIMTVGPSGSGKSFFCNRHLIPSLEFQLLEAGIQPNIQYVNGDTIRREMLGSWHHKHDHRMKWCGSGVYEMLHKKVSIAMPWPIKAHFIVVDAISLSEDFRQRVVAQAKEGGYKIHYIKFDYDDDEEYRLFNDTDPMFKMEVLNRHLEDFRKIQLPERITSKVKSKVFSSVRINVEDAERYKECNLDARKQYDIIGDVHGCYEEMMELLTKLGYRTGEQAILSHPDPLRRIVFVGDLIDKGPKSKEVLKAVKFGYERGLVDFVIGNHENFVYKYINDLIPNHGMEEEIMHKHFTCIRQYADDQEFKDLMKWAYDTAKPFLKGPNFIVTHGPAKNRYLERMDNRGRKMQMKGREGRGDMHSLGPKDKLTAYESFYQYLRDDSNRYAPFHIFGHTPGEKPLRIKNKICIDTGCVHGGKLSSVSFIGDTPIYKSVYPRIKEGYVPEPLFQMFQKRKKK